ncbi:MaoC/PaaZ C-terminal domain-containing protein [Streptacidiphilus anmyonensis]|uniref:MaoC/PaaZ C-terminal domain-containing protein n=1 Tax=Streptacidiphilus anmyonensis TaxID=405782 RepID=UPI0005A8F2D3|nr:MaoC/PaaZ C-terminal domain-containing protein [Streptacidiphilus anmyonensis]
MPENDTPAGAVPARELIALPDLLGLYARAVVPKPRRHAPPAGEAAVSLRAVRVDPGRLRRYREVCGHTDAEADRLPVAYPHLTAFPLSMALMTARQFPLPVLGLVHLANRIEQVRPIAPDASLDHLVRATAPRRHSKGRVFEIVAEARPTGVGEPVWRSVSTYLHRGPGDGPAARSVDEDLPQAPRLDEEWDLPGDLGRRYGAVSGDRNPIHLHPLTARLFGFPRAIAHGMWSKARALAALERHAALPDALTVGVDFRRRVLLPGTARFTAARVGGDGWAFHLTDPGGGHRHLLGRLNPN